MYECVKIYECVKDINTVHHNQDCPVCHANLSSV